MRVMVVSVDPTVIRCLVEAVESLGFFADISHPTDAHANVCRIGPDAVLVDMDGIHGGSAVPLIRAVDTIVPIIAITDDDPAAADAIESGVQESLQRSAACAESIHQKLRCAITRSRSSLNDILADVLAIKGHVTSTAFALSKPT